MRVLLVYPNIRHESLVPPSMALLSRILKNEGHTVRLFDTTDYEIDLEMIDPDMVRKNNLQVIPTKAIARESKGDVHEGFRRCVSEFSPDLIAMTSTESTFLLGVNIIAALGSSRPRTLLGGVFGTFAAQLALRYDEIDLVLRGEGENSLPELCRLMERGEDYTRVRGLAYKTKEGEMKLNQPAQVTDIDRNPIDLDIDLFDDHRLYRPMQGQTYRMLSVETHRGCPYTCAFCNSPAQNRLAKDEGLGSFFRKKSMAKIREEILHYQKHYGIEYVFMWSDTFLAWSPKELAEFCEMYQDIKLPFWCQTRAETIRGHAERLVQLKEVGLHAISFGLEHGNPEFRQAVVDRKCDNDDMVWAFDQVNDLGIPLTVNNIVGFPDETRELVFDTINLNRRFKASSRSASICMPYHGTALRALAEAKGYIDKYTICPSNNDKAIIHMSSMSPEEITGLSACFRLYVDFPTDRWPEIQLAEAQTDEGRARHKALTDEWMALYGPKAYPLLESADQVPA